MKHQPRLVLVVIMILMILTQTYSLGDRLGQAFSEASVRGPRQGDVEEEERHLDWVRFGFIGLNPTVDIGYYEKTGDPISITYVGLPFSSYLVEYENVGLRAVPLYSKRGVVWTDKVSIEVYEGAKPGTSQYMGRKMSPDEFRVQVKQRRIIRREFLLHGTVVWPAEFEFNKSSHFYWPRKDQYDDYRFVEEEVAEYPRVLEPFSRAEAVIEIVRRDGEPLGPGIYRFRAIFDARDFDLRWPGSHKGIFTRTTLPVGVREVQTAEDRANYHYIRAQGFIKEKNLAAAEAELMAGTAARPDSTLPWLRLGEFYENQLKAYDKAIEAYKRAKAISERKGLKPPDGNRPRVKRVNGKVLYEEPPYWPGMIERVKEKRRAARLRGRKR